MREDAVERALVAAVKERGGWAIKLRGVTGIPDRLVLLPGGRLGFAELKRPGLVARKLQGTIHRRLRRLGFKVEVPDTPESARAFVDEVAGA